MRGLIFFSTEVISGTRLGSNLVPQKALCKVLIQYAIIIHQQEIVSLQELTNNRQLKIFLAVDMNLLSRFVVRFEVNFYNSKDSCEGSG